MQRPGRIRAARPAGGRVVVGAVAAFVAQRPEDHAGMILVALHHRAHALHKRIGVAIVAAQIVIERVRFNVGFVNHVQPVAVA